MSLLSAVIGAILSAFTGGIFTYTYLDYKSWEFARQERADNLTGTPIGVELAREMNIEL